MTTLESRDHRQSTDRSKNEQHLSRQIFDEQLRGSHSSNNKAHLQSSDRPQTLDFSHDIYNGSGSGNHHLVKDLSKLDKDFHSLNHSVQNSDSAGESHALSKLQKDMHKIVNDIGSASPDQQQQVVRLLSKLLETEMNILQRSQAPQAVPGGCEGSSSCGGDQGSGGSPSNRSGGPSFSDSSSSSGSGAHGGSNGGADGSSSTTSGGQGGSDGSLSSNPSDSGTQSPGTTTDNPAGNGSSGSNGGPFPSTLPLDYNYKPPAQHVGWSGSKTWEVPPGDIFGVNVDGSTDQMKGVYPAPTNGWSPMIWRWKDTNRPDSITSGVGPDGVPAYKFTLKPGDKPDQGTEGGNPRSELFSVSQAEKTRQTETAPGAVVKDGDNVWMSFGTYIPKDFDQTQRWATLFQLKQQDNTDHPPGWSSISVHGKNIDFNTPMSTADSEDPAARVGRIPIDQLAGKWNQFTIHEVASTGANGLYEVYANGQLVGRYQGPTVKQGIEYHVQYGYYRAGTTSTEDSVWQTPIMVYHGENPGTIPNLIG